MANMDFTGAEISEHLNNRFIVDCAVRKSDIFSFLFLENIEKSAEGSLLMLNFFQMIQSVTVLVGRPSAGLDSASWGHPRSL